MIGFRAAARLPWPARTPRLTKRQLVHWAEGGSTHSARWRSESGAPPPKRAVIGDDRTRADTAYRLASDGTAILWRGDFQNARMLLSALARRVDRRARPPADDPAELFRQHRQDQSRRATTLAMLLVPIEPGHRIPLRRAPDVRDACTEVYGPTEESSVVSLREVLGLIGAHEWRSKGVRIPSLGARIHPHYGVFAPVRAEYAELVAAAPLPSGGRAFDIGTGTGVLAAILARRGVARLVATDTDPRAVACARENIERLGLSGRIEVIETDLFPEGRASLVVCNPPWLPARPTSRLEHAIYDPENRMLRGFLAGLAGHLEPGGEGWLVLSDLAERFGLRSRAELLATIDAAGLRVLDRLDATPRHPRASDAGDPLHAARAAEVTSLWRLAATGKMGS
jgi:methylase of polypeptide subunit release factors